MSITSGAAGNDLQRKEKRRVTNPAGIALLIVFSFLLFTGTCGALTAERHKTALFLHSYHRTDWTETIMEGYISALQGREDLGVHVEYMDTKKTENAEYLRKLRDIYAMKFAAIRFDVILVSDDNAFRFALSHHKELFGYAPIVFCGVNRFTGDLIAGRDNVVGVLEEDDFGETLAFAFRVRPKTRTVYVVHDRTNENLKRLEELSRIIRAGYPRVTVETLGGLSYSRILEAVPTLPRDSIVFFISLWQDAEGRPVSAQEASRILRLSPVPVFGRSGSFVGKGLLGGKCVSGFSQGKAAGLLAKQILDGRRPGDLPRMIESPNRFMFDYAELAEHEIAEDLLPPGSIVLNKPLSFFEQNRSTILTAVAVIIVLLAFIVVLVISLARLKRTSLKLRSRELELLASQETLSGILSASPSGIVKIRGRVFEWVNEAMCSITGYREDELVGHDSRFLYPDDEEYERVGREIYRKGQEESRWVRKDGTVIELLFQVAKATGDSYIAIITDITERIRTARALRESEKLYRNIIEKIQDVFYRFDTNGILIMINPAGARMFHYDSVEDMLGLPMEAFWNDSRDLYRMIEELKDRDRVNDYEALLKRKDGTTLYVSITTHYFLDDDGNVAGREGILRDITERKKAAEALRESEVRYRALFEFSPDAVLVLKDNVYVDCNSQTLELMKCRKEDILGRGAHEFSPDRQLDGTSTVEKAREKMALAMSGKPQFFEWQSKRLDEGGIIDVEVNLTRFDVNDEAYILVIVRDITERKKAEAQIRRLVTAIEQAAEDIMITDARGIIEYVNPAFESITGYSREEAIGRKPDFLVSGLHDREFYKNLWETIEEGKVWTGTIVNRRKDGTFIHEESTVGPLVDSSGAITGYISLNRDVTRQVQLESQLHQSQKMEVIGQLAGGIAHDFNNILSAIIGYSNLVQIKLPPDDPVRKYVDQIVASSGKAAILTQSLLAFSRKQIIDPKPLDVNTAITGTKKLLSRLITEDIVLMTDLCAGPLVVMADLVQIDQVLMNLVANARDAMPTGGTLTISTRRASGVDGKEEGQKSRFACISVSDTGVGMDARTKDKVFEPFFTTKESGKGTGLGLAIVYGIVQQHNGTIHVASEPGHGTTFEVFLPIVEARPDEETEAVADNPRGCEKILVVEDNEELRSLLRTVLSEQGYRVFEAVDGLDAIETQERCQADLVILDVVMPKMNGKEAYDRLKSMDPRIKVLFMSGYTDDIIHQKGILDETIEYIAKPILPRDLLRKVRELLDDETPKKASIS
jgi:PAS domain S-box-containing protein